mmetsp:Transcript_82931/g.231289  ORF Transcript_82931/g.231289 Transcript_82931/m.231289 type:complete len:207 (+) Transcript_82931:1876-2496(+)
MDHPSQVRLVDTHSESHGCHNATQLTGQEAPVRVFTLVHAQRTMVNAHLDSRELQGLSHEVADRLDLGDGRSVDDGGFLVMREVVGKCAQILAEPLFPAASNVQIRPVHGGNAVEVQSWRLTKMERLLNVLTHLRCSCGRECQEWGVWQCLPQPVQLPVTGPEVVAPLGNAVRLVHCDRAKLAGAAEPHEGTDEAVCGRFLRRHVS